MFFLNTNTNTDMKHETPSRRPEVQINEEARRQNPHRHSSSKGIIQILLSLAFYFVVEISIISTLADRLPGRQVWRSQQGKFTWCYQ